MKIPPQLLVVLYPPLTVQPSAPVNFSDVTPNQKL